ncbi:MAG: Gmad2 immunoglobulin-like domain-containing protein [Candidatus Paceibacterota bacterium]
MLKPEALARFEHLAGAIIFYRISLIMQKKLLIIVVVAAAAILAFVIIKKEAMAPGPNGEPTVSPSPTHEPNIIILSPMDGEQVTNPIRMTGKARVFEATFAYRLKDANGKLLYEGFGMTTGSSVPDYGDFDFKIGVPVGATKDLTVEVFEYSAKDGSVINLDSVKVQLANMTTSKVKVYFSNNKLDPAVSCTKVFPIEREILKTQEVGFVAIFELLRGVLPSESKDYQPSIPKGTILNSLIIRDGTAYVDFNHVLEMDGGGSCHVQAIRAQITDTLKQFPTVKSVVISINGRTEDILQP